MNPAPPVMRMLSIVKITSFASPETGRRGGYHLEVALIVNPKVDLRRVRAEKKVPERQVFPFHHDGIGALGNSG